MTLSCARCTVTEDDTPVDRECAKCKRSLCWRCWGAYQHCEECEPKEQPEPKRYELAETLLWPFSQEKKED